MMGAYAVGDGGSLHKVIQLLGLGEVVDGGSYVNLEISFS